MLANILHGLKASAAEQLQARFNKLIVQAYRLTGFVALTTILFGLVSYFTVHAYYFTSRSWVTPVIVSPSDKQVVELRSQLAQQGSLRDGLMAQRYELDARLEDQNRVITAEETYEAEYARSLTADIEFRKKTLAKLSKISAAHARASAYIARANADYARMARKDANSMYDAQLITRDDAVRSAQQGADLAATNLGLDVRSVELDNEVDTLSRDVDALVVADTALRAATGKSDGAMNRDVLAMKRDYDRSKLELARARSSKTAIEKSRAALDGSIARYDGLLKSINESPLLHALDRHVAVAFVPYDNLGAAKVGATVYGCHANFVLCSKVGRVMDVLPGEVTGKHPTQSVEVRGVLVEMDLTDFHDAESTVLHLGHKPLYVL